MSGRHEKYTNAKSNVRFGVECAGLAELKVRLCLPQAVAKTESASLLGSNVLLAFVLVGVSDSRVSGTLPVN